MPFGILACVSPVILVGFAVMCVRTLWLSLVPASRMPREAGCGRCGYSVAGLTTNACPECGADWRQVGIVTPGMIMRYRGGTGGAIVAWTILALGAALVASGFMAVFFTRQMVSTVATTPQTWTTPLTPASGAFKAVDIATSVTMGGRPTATSIELDLHLNDGATWTMKVDPTAGTSTITNAAKVEGPAASLGPKTAAAFLQAAGIDTSKAAVAAEAAELQSILDIQLISPYTQPSQMTLKTLTAGPLRFSGATAMMQSAGPDLNTLVIAIALALLWLALYILGIWFIVARRKRLMGRYAGLKPYSPGM
jgi:hypothetical protein